MDQPRDPPAPLVHNDVVEDVRRVRRHSPVSVVGVPRRSYGYAFVTPPRIRGCGDRNAARRSPSKGLPELVS